MCVLPVIQELVKALDEKAVLVARVAELEGDMKRQLQEQQRQTSEAQNTISSLHSRQMADRCMWWGVGAALVP